MSVKSQSPALPVPQNIWLRGLWMLVLVILVNLAQTVLGGADTPAADRGQE